MGSRIRRGWWGEEELKVLGEGRQTFQSLGAEWGSPKLGLFPAVSGDQLPSPSASGQRSNQIPTVSSQPHLPAASLLAVNTAAARPLSWPLACTVSTRPG